MSTLGIRFTGRRVVAGKDARTPERERLAKKLRRQGMTYRAIADRMGISGGYATDLAKRGSEEIPDNTWRRRGSSDYAADVLLFLGSDVDELWFFEERMGIVSRKLTVMTVREFLEIYVRDERPERGA